MVHGHPQREQRLEDTLEKLFAISESFLKKDFQEIDYQEITDSFREISGARFVIFNLYDAKGSACATMATSGFSGHMKKIGSLLGYEIRGRQWELGPLAAASPEGGVLTRFRSLAEYASSFIPAFIIQRLERLFSIEDVWRVSIGKDPQFAGDFTFIMPVGTVFEMDKAILIFIRQLGLLLVHCQFEAVLKRQAAEFQRSLEEERDKARQASLAKSEFLANMSHEIRTPMNAILGFSEALYYRVGQPENKKMVESILTGGQLLLSLINDILDLSKIEAGKLELSVQAANPLTILEETRMLFAGKAQKKGLRFILDVSRGMPQVLYMDDTRIKQIIFNLVSNAIKFTHSGHVKVSVSFEPQSQDAGVLEIRVEDTGIGIDSELAGHIFEDFYQLNAEATRKYEGTGLGLSICKRLVEKMQGRIGVSSALGKGAVFKVSLPDIKTGKTEEALPLKQQLPSNIQFARTLVMVVDDVLSDIEMIESLLVSLGFDVMHALSGQEALALLSTHKPSMVLLDTRMPGMNGYELLQHIKSREDLLHIPVVAYSATIPPYSSNPLSKLFCGHLQKPIRRQELINELARHLPHDEVPATVTPVMKDPAGPSPLSAEQAEKASEIMHALYDTFLPQWEQIKDQLVLFKIEDFARQLEQFAAAYNLSYLLNFAQKLSQEANSLDIEAMKETLARFPYICGELDAICKPALS